MYVCIFIFLYIKSCLLFFFLKNDRIVMPKYNNLIIKSIDSNICEIVKENKDLVNK